MSPTKIFAVCLMIVSILLTEVYLLSQSKETRLKTIRFNMYIFGDSIILIGLIMLWRTLFYVPKLELQKDHISVPRSSFTVWKVMYSIFIICVLLCLPLSSILISTEPMVLSMVLFMSLGAFLQQIVMLIFLYIVDFLSKSVLKLSQHSLVSLKTKKKIIIIYSLVMTLYGLHNTTNLPEVLKVELNLSKWPSDLNGFSMVQISDIHLGPTIGKQKFALLVDQVMKLKPDAVVITGDLVDSQVERLRDAVEPIRNLRAKHGVYFVTGNHEYYTGDVDHWFIHLQNLGVQVLNNRNVHIGTNGNTFCLAGVDDITPHRMPYGNHGMDLDKALQTCKPNEAIILLSHQPNGAKIAVNSKYDISLILSGHTHGGQMFPLNLFAYLFNPYFAGLYKENEHTYIYVSQGTFYWGIPMRIGTQMEITQFVLTSPHNI